MGYIWLAEIYSVPFANCGSRIADAAAASG